MKHADGDDLGRRRVERDPADALAAIADGTGSDLPTVETVAAAIRTVVDDLLADSYVIVLDAMVLSFGDSPTRRALRERLASSDPVPDAVVHLDHPAVADWLGLDFDTYADRPLATRSLVGMEVCDLLGERAPARPVVWDILEAWDASFTDGRTYKISGAGLEAAFEGWLVDNLDRLTDHDLPVSMAFRQKALPNGRRPDLLCRFTENTSIARAGDWLVVELKATRYYAAAADQIAVYVQQTAEHLATADEQVLALLITDGADHAEVADLIAKGIAHLSLAALGYRRALAQDTALPSAASLSVPMPRVTDMDPQTNLRLISSDESDMSGPMVYWVRLFHDVMLDEDTEVNEARERAAATALWGKREERRVGYARKWGSPEDWPAQHPTTVINLRAPHALRAAVCVRCDWLARAINESGEEVHLHAAAKAHALDHAHDSALDRGENPPKPPRAAPGPAVRFDEARANARRAARRVKRRVTDQDPSPRNPS